MFVCLSLVGGRGRSNFCDVNCARRYKRAGTTRATSSIIKSGQKDTETSILQMIFQQCETMGSCLLKGMLSLIRKIEIAQ